MRRLIGFLLALTLIALTGTASAQSFPTRPVKIVVPFPAGGAADVIVRILGKHMNEALGQNVIVDNHPGAGGAIAFEQVARSAPDGYTLVWTTVGFPIMAATITDLSFKPERDFVHICDVAENPFVLVVNPEVPAKSVRELIDLAKAKPNTINFANNGNGTLTNLIVELFKQQTGVPVVQVAYRGDNFSIADVLAGHVQAMFSNAPVALPHMAAGRLRGLAVTSTRRLDAVPDLPTMNEAGVADFRAVSWQGISAPAATPRAVVDRLNAAARQALQVPEVTTRLRELGAEPIGGTPEQFDALVRQELVVWADVVRRAGMAAK